MVWATAKGGGSVSCLGGVYYRVHPRKPLLLGPFPVLPFLVVLAQKTQGKNYVAPIGAFFLYQPVPH